MLVTEYSYSMGVGIQVVLVYLMGKWQVISGQSNDGGSWCLGDTTFQDSFWKFFLPLSLPTDTSLWYIFHVMEPSFLPSVIPATESSPAVPNIWKILLEEWIRLQRELPNPLEVKSTTEPIILLPSLGSLPILNFRRSPPNFQNRKNIPKIWLLDIRQSCSPHSFIHSFVSANIAKNHMWDCQTWFPVMDQSDVYNDDDELSSSNQYQLPKEPHLYPSLLYCGLLLKMTSSSPAEVLVPSLPFVSLNNLKQPPDLLIKASCPNQWDWTRETYHYDHINRMSLLLLVKTIFVENFDSICFMNGGGGVVDEDCEGTRGFVVNLKRLLNGDKIISIFFDQFPEFCEFWKIFEDFVDYFFKLQSVYDSVNSKLSQKTLSLEKLNPMDKREFAKVVAGLCNQKRSSTSQLLFQMKKMGLLHVTELLKHMDIKKIYMLLFDSVTTKTLCF
eukprot:TRINITY_DN11430_c0_g1_i1.p1 TRINITY_DN11430_c0_g1~~TRINITY_DN11430_c0_g1_i1.p1  ORF type:complete len:444 (+),score=109.91 TRINITY_DN11430_c0_g1_i1:1472-2803(+)